MRLPRWIHKFYAKLFGYFWKPCPICGKMFGGHEKHGYLKTSINSGVCTCENCIYIANTMNNDIFRM